jgi:LysR family transcriptional regulator for metE and metH
MMQMVASGRLSRPCRAGWLWNMPKRWPSCREAGQQGIAKQIYLGAREAELHTDYLQAFIALARAPGLALPAAGTTQKDSLKR